MHNGCFWMLILETKCIVSDEVIIQFDVHFWLPCLIIAASVASLIAEYVYVQNVQYILDIRHVISLNSEKCWLRNFSKFFSLQVGVLVTWCDFAYRWFSMLANWSVCELVLASWHIGKLVIFQNTASLDGFDALEVDGHWYRYPTMLTADSNVDLLKSSEGMWQHVERSWSLGPICGSVITEGLRLGLGFELGFGSGLMQINQGKSKIRVAKVRVGILRV